MEKILLYFVAAFFIIGAADYIEGNKFGVGDMFEKGIKTMGSLALSMLGILSLIPFLIDKLGYVLNIISEKVLIDPSIFLGSIFAVDMGGYNLCTQLAYTSNMGIFSGIIISSMLGCTISFTIPLAIGIVRKENIDCIFKGFICGIISLPAGLIIAGLILGIPFIKIIYNLLPVILLVIIISIGIIIKPQKTLNIFKGISTLIRYLGIIGIIVQGVYSICGVKLLNNIMPLNEVIEIVGRIAIFLSGAYVMIEFLKRLFRNHLLYIEEKAEINSDSIMALIGSLASAIIIFDDFDKLDYKGKIICTAFSVSGAYVFGGQLGYVSSIAPQYLGLYVAIKLLSGIISIFFAVVFLKCENKS